MIREDIEALRRLTNHASTNIWCGEAHFLKKEVLSRVLDAYEKMQNISSYELTKIASKHVIGVVGGGMIDFDECQGAIETYLKEVRGE